MMRLQRQSSPPYQRIGLLSGPRPTLVTTDEGAITDAPEETVAEQLGYRFGRLLRSMSRPRQRSRPDRTLPVKTHSIVRLNRTIDAFANSPNGHQEAITMLDSQPEPPVWQPRLLHQEAAADGLRELRENPLVQYGLRQFTAPQVAEAILGGALILGLAVNGDLTNVASLGAEMPHAIASILQLALSLLVGAHLAELLAIVVGGLALLLYQHWDSRNFQRGA